MNSDDGTDCATGRATRPASPDRTEGGSHWEPRERRHPIAEQSDQWQQPVATVSHRRTSMTMAQRAPLAFPATVPQEGWEEVQRPAAEPQPGTAKTVSLSAHRLPAETAEPPASGELATFERCVRAEVPTRLKARRNPRSRQTEAPALPGGRLRAGSQGPRARARPPPASGAMPCLRRA